MLHVHYHHRIELLADRLIDGWATPPTDPFTPEWVMVPTPALKRWFMGRLALAGGAEGIAANVVVELPGALRRRLVEAVPGGAESLAEWSASALTWPVLAAMDADGSLASLEGARTVRARRIADTFDRYIQHRPGMLRRWSDHKDLDGAGAPLDAAHQWQADLWRKVSGLIGVPSPAHLVDDIERSLVTGASVDPAASLPGRLAMLGFTSMPRDVWRWLVALQHRREVDVFQLIAFSGAVGGVKSAADLRPSLVRSWGRSLWASWSGLVDQQWTLAADANGSRSAFGDTALGRLQRAIAGEDEGGGPVPAPPGEDRSIWIHGCAGPTAQLRAAREAVVHLMADDPTLRPDDIAFHLIEPEVFEPLILATSGDTDGAPDPLPIRVIGRSQPGTAGFAGAAVATCDLLQSRVGAADLLGWLALDAVQLRFGLSPADVAVVDSWIRPLAIRWGVDARHRSRFDVAPDYATSTWRDGVDRVLLGAAMAAGDGVDGRTVPYVAAPEEVLTAARMDAVVTALQDVIADAAGGPRSMTEWVSAVERYFSLLLHPGVDDTAAEVTVALTDIKGRSAVADALALSFDEAMAAIRAELATHRRMGLQLPGFAVAGAPNALMALPARVVVLVGLDDAAAVRTPRAADDLVAAAPKPGDREPREELRTLLLGSVMAARDHLVVTFAERSLQTNRELARPVLLDELCDAATEANGGVKPAWRSHPAFRLASENFEPDAPWSFDAVGSAALRRAEPEASDSGRRGAGAEPIERDAALDLVDVTTAVVEPLRVLRRDTLRLGAVPAVDEDITELTVSSGGLGQWAVASAVTAARLAGDSGEHPLRLALGAGLLPPGSLGASEAAKVEARVEVVLAAAAQALGVELDDLPSLWSAQRVLSGRVVLPSGEEIVAAVPVWRHGGTLLTANVSITTAAKKHRLETWLRLAWLTAHSHTPARAVVVYRKSGQKPAADVFVASYVGDAADDLSWAAAVFREARSGPIWLAPETGYLTVEGTFGAARIKWEGGPNQPAENPLAVSLGGPENYSDLLDDTRFRQLAAELWARVDHSLSVEDQP